ncbi:MAG: hypothetical protein H3Z53_03090 [archaeon]|nr:hypothetical protein [archaeon]MCP8313347.1 hypothetical protein [archaeon]
MTNYIRGEVIRLEATFKDFDGTLIDADSIQLKIYDAKGTLKATVTPTKSATGKYYYDYSIPSDGETGVWKGEWKATKGSVDSIERVYWEVVA